MRQKNITSAFLYFLTFFLFPVFALSQNTELSLLQASSLSELNMNNILSEKDKSVKFAISVNPLGFVQFGPVINAEVGLTENVSVNVHARLASLGLLSYAIHADIDGLDEYTGTGFGGGAIYFLNGSSSSWFIGALMEYEKSTLLYAANEDWEWKQFNKTSVFIFNGGYRFRFDGGFFMNTGAYLGAASTKWNWHFTDFSYSSDGEIGKTITPFGMLELTLGFEF